MSDPDPRANWCFAAHSETELVFCATDPSAARLLLPFPQTARTLPSPSTIRDSSSPTALQPCATRVLTTNGGDKRFAELTATDEPHIFILL